MPMAVRNRTIRERLDKHFLEGVDVPVATPEPTWWWSNAAMFGPPAKLGWGVPQWNPESTDDNDIHPLIIAYCPEVIDEQTADLTDEELDEYLKAVEWTMDNHIVLLFEIRDDDVRHATILERLEQEFPVSYKVLRDIEAVVDFAGQIADDIGGLLGDE